MTWSQYDRRPRWRARVLSAVNLRPLTKLVLLVTCELGPMRRDGKVCVSRATVAEALGIRHEQRVSDGWKQACETGFLALLHKGSHGRPSTYQALIPEPLVTADPVTISDRHTRSLESPQIRSLGADPTSLLVTADPVTITTPAAQTQPLDESRTNHLPDEGSKEDEVGTDFRSQARGPR